MSRPHEQEAREEDHGGRSLYATLETVYQS